MAIHTTPVLKFKGPLSGSAQSAVFANNGIGAVCNASAAWVDDLTLQNVGLLQSYSGEAYLYCQATATGGGTNGEANLDAGALGDGLDVFDSARVEYGPGGSSTPLQVGFNLPASKLLTGVSISMHQ